MIKGIKRFALALVFLSLVILLMLLGTLGVEKFADSMFKDANITMKPQGKQIVI